jgi:hypothetical protein
MRWLVVSLVACGFLWSDTSWAQPAPDPGDIDVIPVGPGGRMRIEFLMGSSVFGQTTRPGEVRILERKDTQLKSMVRRRTGFQKEIIQTVFPDYTR